MNSSALPELEPSLSKLEASSAAETAEPRFKLRWPSSNTIDARYDEALMQRAADEGPAASLWQASRSLVVPRSYRRFEDFESVSARFKERGWPVIVRQTGGGIVPQGPGIINFSLAYRVQGAPMRHSEPGYELICSILREALQTLGVHAFPAAVEASFCDGRYNLAIDRAGTAVKVAGTAQMWRRIPGTREDHIGLVHALVLLDADTAALTGVLNEFESALGNDRRYRPEAVISIAEQLAQHVGPQTNDADRTSARNGRDDVIGSLHQAFTIAVVRAMENVHVPEP